MTLRQAAVKNDAFIQMAESYFLRNSGNSASLVREFYLSISCIATDTSIQVNYIPKSLQANLGYVVIDPYTSECEVRRVTNISGTTLTIAALGYGHALNDVVLWIDKPMVNVKWFNAKGDGVTSDVTAFSRAEAQAAICGGVVFIPVGKYNAIITSAHDGIKYVGERMPVYDSGSGVLIDGTIILGKIDLNDHAQMAVRNLGVDVTGLSTDGILTGSPSTSGGQYEFENLAILGDGYAASDHALLCQSGADVTIKNIKMYKWYHGLALRCSYVNGDQIYGYECTANTVIIKSDANSEDARNINLSNIIADGLTDSVFHRAGPVRVQSYDASYETKFINIANLVTYNGGEACVIVEQVDGLCAYVNVTNAHSYSTGDVNTRADFDVSGATDVYFTNCISEGCTGYSFRSRDSADRVHVVSGASSSPGVSEFTGPFSTLHLKRIWDETRLRTNFTPPDVGDEFFSHLAAQWGGYGGIDASSTEDIFHVLWNGPAGTYAAAVFEVTLLSMSGGHTQMYKYRIALNRPGGSSLEAAAAADGSTLASGAGSTSNLTLSVDVATANALIVKITETAGYACNYSYFTTILQESSGVEQWMFRNQAG